MKNFVWYKGTALRYESKPR